MWRYAKLTHHPAFDIMVIGKNGTPMWFRMGCMHQRVILVVWEDWIQIDIQYRWLISLPVVYRRWWSKTCINISACCDHMVLWLPDSVFVCWLLWYTILIITCTGIKTTLLLITDVLYTTMTSSNCNIFHATGRLCWEFTQRPVTWSFDLFFDLRLNKRFSRI